MSEKHAASPHHINYFFSSTYAELALIPFKMFAKSIGSKQKRERRMCERLSLRDADVRCTPTCRISLSFVFRRRFTYSTKSYFTLYTTFLPLYIQLLYIQLSQVLVYWSYRSYRSAQELKADTLPAHALGASPRAWRLSALTSNFKLLTLLTPKKPEHLRNLSFLYLMRCLFFRK